MKDESEKLDKNLCDMLMILNVILKRVRKQ